MRALEAAIVRRGGIARTGAILAGGQDWEWLRIAAAYGKRIIHVRKGWWATCDTPLPVIEARMAGGRLACISALDLFDGRPASGALHIEVERNSSRRTSLLPPERRIIVHRPARRSDGGDASVTREAAVAQAAKCRGLSGEHGER